MATQNIQPMPAFEPRSDPTSTSARWTRWLERFNTYLLAADIKDDARKRALLLYQAGPEVYEIFKTLQEDEDKDYKSAVKALTEYFEPEKNVIYQTYVFRQATQGKDETIDEFHTRLRGLAKHCDFANPDFEIKMQIVTNGTSSRLRKKALQDSKYSLADMLIVGRKYETSAAQAGGIEGKFKTNENINATAITKPTKKKCYFCGFKYPHDNRPCPAKSCICNQCGIKGHFAKVCRSRDKSRKKPFTSTDDKRQGRRDQKKQGKQQANAVETSQNESDQESLEEDYVYTISKEIKGKAHTTIKINGQDVLFLVDTGATVDIIDSVTYEKLKKKGSLQRSSTKIYAYGFQTPLPLKGQFQATLESKKRYATSQLYVIDGAAGNLLSAKTAQDLALVQLINTISGVHAMEKPKQESTTSRETKPEVKESVPQSKDPKIQEILNKYCTVFQGQGKLENQKIKLHIRDNVKPVIQPQRRIPYHMRKDVSKELKKLEEQDIIEKVADQPTPWISPIVATPKKDGGIRLCVDMREANQAIERERHTIPTLQDFKAEVNGSKFFSKIDLKQAYHQLELHPDSRFITTFSTHEGLYQYKRLNYGTNSAAKIFQNVLQQNLSDIRGVKNLMDDIIIHGKTRKAHDEALESCLKRLTELNLKAKGEKCEFLREEITFFGLKFTAVGTKPDPERIANMVKVPAPKTTGEVRSFLGMANTCHEYISDYATITAPLRELTKKNSVFKWEPRHRKAFEELKKKLTSAPVMAYFDTKKRSLVIVDGSPYGISAILAQKEHNSPQYKIISYASRALTPVEQRYSQTDIEGLSLVWGIEHFRMFLIGSEFDVITDHKALEAIFNNPRSRPPARIERWMMRLQPFNFKVIYRKGSLNEADYLSRHPITIAREEIASASAEDYVNYVTNCSVPKSMTLEEIKKATRDDLVLQKVRKCLKEGKWDENDPGLEPFKLCAEELTYNASQDILLKNTRLVIPKILQERATQLGHIGHQGIEKTKALLREKIWYPTMDKRVKDMVDKCIACQSVGKGNNPEPMKITPTEDKPWTSIAIDFYGPVPRTGQYLLVVIDTYSKFPEIEIISSTEAKTCIPKLDTIFARYGIPSKITTDNGPPFNGKEFETYTKTLGIEWKTITPLWPQGNAVVERFMKPIGKLLKTAEIEGKNWRQELQRFLLQYRSTPHQTTKVAPCELLFNRQIKGYLPELKKKRVVNKHNKAKRNLEKSKEENKEYYDRKRRTKEAGIKKGDTVICKQKKNDKLTPKFDPEYYTVVRRKYNTITAEKDGKTVTRNASYFKKILREESDDDWDDTTLGRSSGMDEQQKPEARPRRSTRIRRPVVRYQYQT